MSKSILILAASPGKLFIGQSWRTRFSAALFFGVHISGNSNSDVLKGWKPILAGIS